MTIGELLGLLVRGQLLPAEEAGRLSGLPATEVYAALQARGRSFHRELERFLADRIPSRPQQTTEWTYEIALGRVAGSRGADAFLFEPIDKDITAFFLWETRGTELDAVLGSLVILGAVKLLHEPIPPGPSGVARQVNRVLAELEPGGAYTSLCVALLDVHRGVVEYCCAGTPAPLLYRATERDVSECTEGWGIPAGIERDSQFSTGYLLLRRGDILLLSTDGMWKAQGARGSVITSAQWKRRLRQFADRQADGIRKGLQRELRLHLMHRRARDGATVAVIKRRGHVR